MGLPVRTGISKLAYLLRQVGPIETVTIAIRVENCWVDFIKTPDNSSPDRKIVGNSNPDKRTS